tara:strand:+ start:3125 stop:3508 length:384 start_codon:yes stop_codon:yes gene_type:complete
MIKDFLILDCIGKKNRIGLRIKNNFYVHTMDQKTDQKDHLVSNILNLLEKHKVILDDKFSIIVNSGPGSFSSIRTSISIAKGLKISKNINLYSYKNTDLDQFDLENIELLITQELIQNKLIKPIYLS